MNEESSIDLVDGDRRDIRRPMNAFLIFCKRHRSIVRERNPDLDNRNVTRILGDLWANLKDDEKTVYTDLAKQYKDAFMKANPDYKWHNPDKIHPITKPNTRPTNARIVKSDTVINVEGAIVPGKLADPSNMGGLSLLLMAGQQSSGAFCNRQVFNDDVMENRLADNRNNSSQQALQYYSIESMENRQSGGNTGASDEADNTEASRTSLLQLAEMCSTEFSETLNENWEEICLETNNQPFKEPEVCTVAGMHVENQKIDSQPIILQASSLTPDHHLRQALFGHQPRRSHEQVDKSSTLKIINNNGEKKDKIKDLSAYDFDEQDEEDNGVLSCGKRVMEHLIDRLYDSKKKIRLEKYTPHMKNISRNNMSVGSTPIARQAYPIKKTKPSLDTSKKPFPIEKCIVNKMKPLQIKKETPQSYVEKVINETYCISETGGMNGNQSQKQENKSLCRLPAIQTCSDESSGNHPQTSIKTEPSPNQDARSMMTKEESNFTMIKPQSMTKIKSKSPQPNTDSNNTKPAPIFSGLKSNNSYTVQGAVDSGFEEGSVHDTMDYVARSKRFHSNSFSEDISRHMSSNNDDIDDNQPVRKSKRRNRGQRYQELIHEGIIQPSKERLAAWRNEWETTKEDRLLPDEKEFDFFLETGLKSVRKRTVSESDKCNRSPDDSKRYKTSDFDLEAQIATLPACSVEPVGRGHRKTSFSKPRHDGDVNGKQVEQSADEKEKFEQITSNIKWKPPDTAGSQKRKARKTSITHLIICKDSTDSDVPELKLVNAGELAMVCSSSKSDVLESNVLENMPPDLVTDTKADSQQLQTPDDSEPPNHVTVRDCSSNTSVVQKVGNSTSIVPRTDLGVFDCENACNSQEDYFSSGHGSMTSTGSGDYFKPVDPKDRLHVEEPGSEFTTGPCSTVDRSGQFVSDSALPAAIGQPTDGDNNLLSGRSVFQGSGMHEHHGVHQLCTLRQNKEKLPMKDERLSECDNVEDETFLKKRGKLPVTGHLLEKSFRLDLDPIVEKACESSSLLCVNMENLSQESDGTRLKFGDGPSTCVKVNNFVSVERSDSGMTHLSDMQKVQHNSSLGRTSSLVVYDSERFTEMSSNETELAPNTTGDACASFISSSSKLSNISDCVTTVMGASSRPATFVYS